MKTKRFSLLWMLFAMLVTLAGCNPSDQRDQEPLDCRDPFVGAYDYTAEGGVDIYVAGQKMTTVPLNDAGTLTITKEGPDNQVVIVGYNDSIRAMVFGNQLVLETTSAEYDYGQLHMQLFFSDGKATLTDRQLEWQSKIAVTATYGDYAANGNGQMSIHATKK